MKVRDVVLKSDELKNANEILLLNVKVVEGENVEFGKYFEKWYELKDFFKYEVNNYGLDKANGIFTITLKDEVIVNE